MYIILVLEKRICAYVKYASFSPLITESENGKYSFVIKVIIYIVIFLTF